MNYLSLFALLLLNDFTYAIDKAGLVVWNEPDVRFLIGAEKQHQNFDFARLWIRQSGKMHTTRVSCAHDFGKSIQCFAVLRVEHHGTGVFEMGPTKVADQRLRNKLHQQFVWPVFSFYFCFSVIYCGRHLTGNMARQLLRIASLLLPLEDSLPDNLPLT